MSVYPLALIAPLLSAFTYQREGRSWRSAIGFAILAVLFSIVIGIGAGFVYGFGIGVNTELCGSTPWEASVAAVMAYAVVATWAAMRARRVWAWGGAVAAAVAVSVFVSYFFARAHGYCET